MKFLFPVACLLLAAPAFASGYVEAPPVQAVLASFADCVAELENRAGSDMIAAAAMPVADQTISLMTEGIQSTENASRYHSDLWYHNSHTDPTTGLTVTSHSYTRVAMTCAGATLSITNGQGYTLDTFQ